MDEKSQPTPDITPPIINNNIIVQPAEVNVPAPIVNIPPNDPTEAKTANRITFWGLLVNILLFLITLYTFYQTKRSVDLAAKQFDYTQEKDKDDAVTNKTKDIIAAEKEKNRLAVIDKQRQEDFDNNKKSLELSRKAVETQLSSFKETQKEFEFQNNRTLAAFNAKMAADSNKLIVALIKIKALDAKIYYDTKKTLPYFAYEAWSPDSAITHMEKINNIIENNFDNDFLYYHNSMFKAWSTFYIYQNSILNKLIYPQVKRDFHQLEKDAPRRGDPSIDFNKNDYGGRFGFFIYISDSSLQLKK